MKFADVYKLAASKLADTGAALWQAVRPVTNDVDDVEPFGEVDVFQALGVTSMPYPADDDGHAEGVGLEGIGGKDLVIVGARDTRTAKITGNLKPGDTVVHSTGPSQAAQVQCKEEKRQVVLATKNKAGETQALVLDGKNGDGKCQIAVSGCMFEIADGGFTLTDATGKAGIIIRNGAVSVFGQVTLGGMTPLSPLLAAPSPGTPVPGVFAGR